MYTVLQCSVGRLVLLERVQCVLCAVQCAVLGDEVSLVRKCGVYSVQCSVARLVLLDSVQRALCSVSQCSVRRVSVVRKWAGW